MMWELPAGMAVAGMISGANKEARDDRFNRAQSDITRYSPWSSMTGKITPSTSSAFNGGMSGAMSGMMLGQQFNSTGDLERPTESTDKAGANSLGGIDLSNSFGQSFANNPYSNMASYPQGQSRYNLGFSQR